VSRGGSFGANPLRQTIGLGKATAITAIEVFWPTTGETQVVDTGSKAFRTEVHERTQARVRDLAGRFAAVGIDFIHVDAAGDVIDPLVRFFRMRALRGR